MHITGMPRSGTTLLLLLLAATVTNKRVYADKESPRFRSSKNIISKDPFTAIRYPSEEICDPLYMIRHPWGVLTSVHSGVENKFYWDEKPKWKAAPHSIKSHIEHLGHPRIRYEDLCTRPDQVQEELGDLFGLSYSRKFSGWPFSDFQFPPYWYGALGAPEPIRPPRELEGDIPEHIQQAARELGYD